MDDRLTDDEVRQLLEVPRARRHGNGKPWRHAERDELILWVMVHAGLRPHEVVGLRCADVHGDRILVRRRVEGQAPREAPLLGELPHHWLCTIPFGISDEQVRRLVPIYGALARIRREVTPRALRCTYAANLFLRRPSLQALARALGVGTSITAAQYLSPELIGGSELAAS